MIALVFFILTLFVFVSALTPAYHDVQRIRGEASSRRNALVVQQNVIERVRKLIGVYEEEQEFERIISLALPLAPDTAGILAHINGLVLANNLALESFAASRQPFRNAGEETGRRSTTPSLLQPVGVVTFQARVSGTYENFKRFLGGIETNARLFDVRSVVFEPAGRSNQNAYVYELTIAAYYQNP